MGNEEREALLQEYLAAGVLGYAVGFPLASSGLQAGIGTSVWGFAVGDWGAIALSCVIAGIFGFLPGGFVAGSIILKWRRIQERHEIEGLRAGLMAFLVYTVISLITSAIGAARATGVSGYIMGGWGISVVFAILFYLIGGYLSGWLRRAGTRQPSFLLLGGGPTAPPPPPPPGGVPTCRTCGQPLTYVQQYGKWYCHRCKKYA